MKHANGRTDEFSIHIGGGAFDAGTSQECKYYTDNELLEPNIC